MATHHLSWPTLDYNTLIPSCTLLITATKEYKLSEKRHSVILNTWVGRMRGGKV